MADVNSISLFAKGSIFRSEDILSLEEKDRGIFDDQNGNLVLLALEPDETTRLLIDSTVALFSGLNMDHLSRKMPLCSTLYTKSINITCKDKNGEEKEREIYGLYVKKDIPFWFSSKLSVYLTSLSDLFYFSSENDQVLTISIDTKEKFEAWLTENPSTNDYSTDCIFVCMTYKELESVFREFTNTHYGWKIASNDIFGLLYEISKISKDEDIVVIKPMYPLNLILKQSFAMSIKEFEQNVLSRGIHIYSRILFKGENGNDN